MSALDQVPAAVAAELTRLCLDHLHDEEACWQRVLATLPTVQQALAGGKWTALADTLEAQAQAAQECERVHRARQQLRVRLAEHLQAPAGTLTLEAAAQRLPAPERRQVLVRRDSLRLQAEEAQRRSRACTSLAQYHLDFIQRLFGDLTGGGDVGRYGPQGTMRPAACGSLIQARG
jgi:hypothetical protein